MIVRDPLYVSRYTLKSAQSLNARSGRREHEGALIRVGEGYGCIHPWPELGDAPLDEQLALLISGNSTPLIEASLQCAKIDGAARAAGVSLYQHEFPESHWLVLAGDSPEKAKQEGFHSAKIKGSTDLEAVREVLNVWRHGGFQIRLDFNDCLDSGAFLDFWKALNDGERDAIEVVEDPEVWSESGWMNLRDAKVPLAVDRDPLARYRLGDIYVVKPAFFTGFSNAKARFLVTSYMDHAFGQMFAGMRASRFQQSDQFLTCGLLTHRCFEKDAFFEQIQTDGPRLLPVEGTGLGFDDLLEKLPWKRIN